MHTLKAQYYVTVSELKANPNKVIKEASGQPVAVLSHNKATMYLIGIKEFEAYLSYQEECELCDRIEQMKAGKKISFDSTDF